MEEIEKKEIVEEDKQTDKKKKRLPIWAIVLGIFLLLFFMAFFVITQSSICVTSSSQYQDHSHYFRNIVTENEHFKEVPLTETSILGSHDAFTSNISHSSMPNSNEPDNIVNNGFLRWLAKGAMVRYSKAQALDAYEQLMSGVRYFDARITYLNDVYYTSHGLVSGPLSDTLRNILKFLDENPGEYVLFHLNKYYQGNSNWDNLVSYISTIKYKEKSIFDYVNYTTGVTTFKELNYNIITSNGTKGGMVLFSSAWDAAMPFNQFSTEQVVSKWHNKCKSEHIIPCIREEAERCLSLGNDYLRINQAQLTPSEKDIWNSFCGWSLLHMGEDQNQNMMNLSDFETILDSIPIYMCDYATINANGFNSKIINLMSERNAKL